MLCLILEKPAEREIAHIVVYLRKVVLKRDVVEVPDFSVEILVVA
jgi:hypothetical protein